MQIDVERIEWKIIYAIHFFSRRRDEFDSFLRFALSRIASFILLLLYAAFLAAFILFFFGVAPFYIIQYFGHVAAPWAAEPIIHGFKLYLAFSTVAVIPMILASSHATKPGTRRFMKDITFAYCSVTIPLTMLELVDTYPEQWSTTGAKAMTTGNWILYFGAQMLDAILLGHFTQFIDLIDFPTPNSLYVKILLFLMKAYFAATSTWYFYFKMRFRLTGAITISCTTDELKQWLPKWARHCGIDEKKVRIKPVALLTNINRISKPVTFEEMFGEDPAKPDKKEPLETDKNSDSLYSATFYELPIFFMGILMIGGALMISLISIPILSEEWIQKIFTVLKIFGSVIAFVVVGFTIVIIVSLINKRRKSKREQTSQHDQPQK